MSDEWKVSVSTDPGRPGYEMSCTTDPTQPVLILAGKAEEMAVAVNVSRILNLYEWDLVRQRMSTLIEVARTNERIAQGALVAEGVPPGPDLTDTQCHACRKNPKHYVSWGFRCEEPGCRGTYYPRSFVEARFAS